MNLLLWSAAAGAAAMYFLDPQSGPQRRSRARDTAEQIVAKLRKARARVEGKTPTRRVARRTAKAS